MPDQRNIEHLKRVKGTEAVQNLTGPAAKSRGRGGPRGHIARDGETVSHHIVNGLSRRDKKKLFNFGRPHWTHRRSGRQ